MSVARPGFARLWRDLSLSARLMLGSGIALALSGAVLLYSIIVNEVERNRVELSEKVKYEVESLTPAVTEQAVIGDYALIQQILDARVGQRDIALVSWIDNVGNPLSASSPKEEGIAPDWFVRWADIRPQEEAVEIVVGGEPYGRVLIRTDPTATLNHLWQQSMEMFQLLLFLLGIFFGVTLAIANNGLRPLYALASSAARFGQGDYSVRIEPDGPPEVLATIHAFNHMAESIARDMAERKQAREILFAEKERAQVTLASIADAVVTTNTQGEVDYLNPMAEKLTGWRTEEVRGAPLSRIFYVVQESSGERIEDPVASVLRQGQATEPEAHAVLISREGQRWPIEHTAAPIRNREGEIIGVVLVFRDVGESRKLAHQLSWQASHDALTGLVNRLEFDRRLRALVEDAQTQGRQHALLYLDLDQFKVVNDTCGHVAGDELLRQVASLLESEIRESDTLARLGGDEFGVLLQGCDLPQALQVAEKLRRALANFRFAWQDKTFASGISIGLVAITGEGESAASLLGAADAACYSAKDKGRNRVQAYRPDDNELAQRRGEMQWVSRITRAFEENRFRLYCQRILGLRFDGTGEEHYEVLVRMVDEGGGLVPPMSFIPAAERYGLMHTIDQCVMTLAFSRWRALAASCARLPMLSINLSGASISDDHILVYIHEQFKRHQVQPRAICFEITETAAIANLTRASKVIRELKELGCRFSLDDFGSGLSSFAYLKNLPVDYLKIDGGFVKDMASDPIDCAMVRAINDIGHVMGIRTIAEWVENEVTLGMLKTIGVDYVQGFAVHMPEPIEAVGGHSRPGAGLRLVTG